MDQDIKKIKEGKRQESLEEEVKDVQSGKLEVEIKSSQDNEIKTAADSQPATDEKNKNNYKARSDGRTGNRKTGRSGHRRGRRGKREEDSEFEQKIVDLARVTRVMAGGKRMRFRVCIIIGDRKGRVAYGLAKGKDVTIAISKAVTKAKKDIVTVPFIRETIPFGVEEKFKAARVLLRPAKKGKGIIAGGAVRVVLELAGVPNVVAKILGTNNKVTNVKATIQALKRFEEMFPQNKKSKNQKNNKTKDKEIKPAEKEIKKENNNSVPAKPSQGGKDKK